jgi:hypothetical protein
VRTDSVLTAYCQAQTAYVLRTAYCVLSIPVGRCIWCIHICIGIAGIPIGAGGGSCWPRCPGGPRPTPAAACPGWLELLLPRTAGRVDPGLLESSAGAIKQYYGACNDFLLLSDPVGRGLTCTIACKAARLRRDLVLVIARHALANPVMFIINTPGTDICLLATQKAVYLAYTSRISMQRVLRQLPEVVAPTLHCACSRLVIGCRKCLQQTGTA